MRIEALGIECLEGARDRAGGEGCQRQDPEAGMTHGKGGHRETRVSHGAMGGQRAQTAARRARSGDQERAVLNQN